MAHELFDFYPFNIQVGGPFLGFFIPFALFVYVVAFVARRVLAPYLVDRAASAPAVQAAPTLWAEAAGGAYRSAGYGPAPAPAATEAPPLRVGWIPAGDGLYSVAYLRSGVPGAANLLVANAVGDRWLIPGNDGFAIDPSGWATTKLSREFKARLSKHGGRISDADLKTEAESAASDSEHSFQSELLNAGLIRSSTGVATYVLMMAVAVVFVLTVGFIRVAWLAEIDRPFANLMTAMIFVGGAGGRPRTRWLEEEHALCAVSELARQRDVIVAGRRERGPQIGCR